MTPSRFAPSSAGRGRDRGFTLIEMVMVIAISAIVAAVAGRFIARPVQGFMDVERRARLTDAAELALERMTREIRLALPNSVRVDGSGRAVEFLRIAAGGRYREAGPGDTLDFTASSDSFDVVGTLADAASVSAVGGAGPGDCISGNADCLVIYNTGQPGADAYRYDNIGAVRTVSPAAVSFGAAAPFPFQSPAQRFYIVDTPVTFLCQPGAGGTLRRYSGYALTTNQADIDSDGELTGAGAGRSLLVDRVSACSFSYQAGTATRGGLVTLSLTLQEAGERVSLLEQVHVSNLP